MSNLGLNRNKTSAQLANDAEVTANQAMENQIADVDGVGKKEKAGRKDSDASFNGTIPFIGDEKEDEEEKENNENESSKQHTSSEENNDLIDEDDEEYEYKYHFKFNEENKIEIWDSETGEVIRTISPEDASKSIADLASVPGIFVNKEI